MGGVAVVFHPVAAGVNLMPAHRFVFLDGLRGIAAAAVVILHFTGNRQGSSDFVPHGSLAVDFFFILSGFVIAFAYDQRLRSGRLNFWSFAVARLIRLYPMLLLGLATGAVFFSVRIVTRAEWGLWPAFVEVLGLGILMLPSHLIVGEGYTTAYPFNVPSWSLFFELAANAVYAAIASRMTNVRLGLITAIGAVALFIVMYTHGGVTGGQEWATFPLGFWRILFAFSAGVLIYRLADRLPDLPPLAGLALACGLIVSLVTPFAKSWMYDGVCIFIAFPLIIALGAGVRVKHSVERLCLFVGRLSYPLYLLHYPAVRVVGVFLRSYRLSGAALILFFVAVIAGVVVLSIFCLIFIDEPVRRALDQRVRRSRSLPAAHAAPPPRTPRDAGRDVCPASPSRK